MIISKQLKPPQLVLVADDQEINRDVLGMILEDDYDVIYAADGVEALEQIEARQNELSVVLLELMMPRMDGFEVLRRVRENEYLKNLPVIVLTAEKKAELKALQMGAADFITKPFDMHEVILARVGRIIELSEGRQLISAAEHDPLTMLYNRNFFFEYANRIYTYHPNWKMDAIVMNIEHNEKDFRLVQLVLDIAKYLRMPVVAEGVETEAQMHMLKDAGCDLVQGYYFSRPLPPEEFEKLIEREIKIDRGNDA